ncbi:MAG: NADPH:quinone oxidoreductase family protein [Anaerolineae bacterium]|nr:NADPH:quinone oxidoreductase family protein [Anaerolineae bacterium]
MKAILCKAFGEPDTLVLEDIDSPKVRGGEVKIRVRACGVNFPDLLMIQGKYQVKPDFPFSPGAEVAGDVLEVGTGVDNIKVGDRVIGIVNQGGFAEEVIAPAMMTLPMPDSMSYEHGAVFSLVYGTSHLGLSRRANLQAGETLLVLGAAGGVGLTAVEIGKLMGATVIAAASTDEKLALTREYGADHTINYTEENLRDTVKDITDGQFADVIYDPVGGDIFDAAVRCMAWESRYLVIGFASGRIPELAANRVLIKNSSLVGLYWGAYAFKNPAVMQNSFQKLFQWYSEGKVKPHIDRSYPLADAAQALIALGSRQAKGKLVIIP